VYLLLLNKFVRNEVVGKDNATKNIYPINFTATEKKLIFKQTFIELETAKRCEKNAQLEHRLLSFLRTNNSFACLCNGFFSSSKYSP